jgi:hypothetical protein
VSETASPSALLNGKINFLKSILNCLAALRIGLCVLKHKMATIQMRGAQRSQSVDSLLLSHKFHKAKASVIVFSMRGKLVRLFRYSDGFDFTKGRKKFPEILFGGFEWQVFDHKF